MADLNANKVDDMLEALNRAIEIHTKNAVQGLPYNKSELVEIVDITERNLGKYIVWNGSARYQAFSENTTYEMGTKVYVNIPNDDFKEQKHIIGPYVADGESAVFYRNPLTDFQPLTGNILQDKQVGEKKNGYDTTYGLVANYNKQGKTVSVEINDEIQEVPAKDEVVEIYRAPDLNGSGYQGYKYIGISADFKTLLNTFSPIAGDYGIVVTIWHAVKYDVQEDAAIEKRDYFLSVKDMIGNVYNFNTYFKQAALYDISAFGEVQSIIVGFYQRGNFIMSNNKEVPTHYTLNGESHLLSDNILVRNVSVTFGDDLMEHNDRATIFTRNGTTYDPVQKDIFNTKTIELRWTHLNSTSDEFENLDSSKASSQCGNYKIHWYEDSIHDRTDYTTKAQSETDNAEAKMKAYKAWDKIETNQSEYTEDQIQEARLNLINTFNLKKGTDYTLSENGTINFISQIESRVNQAVSNAQSEANRNSSIAGDTLAGSGWKPIDVANTEWSIDFTPNYKRSYSKVMVIVEYDEGDTKHKIKSNILQFDNLRITSNSLSDDKASALRIGFSDGTDGDYPIYNGTTGELLSREDVTRDRKFQATCKSLIDDKDYLNGNETIIWQIPKTGSMILMNQIFLEENSSELFEDESNKEENKWSEKYKEFLALFSQFAGTLDYDAKYYYIKRSVSDSINPVNSKQTYQIAPYYNKANTNNTIYCYIIKNSDIFKGSASLIFGQHGTSGTDYTFSLGFIQKVNETWNVKGPGDTALTIGDPYYLEIGFDLFNSKNEKIDLTPEQKNAIIKLWVDKKDSENKTNIDGFYSGLSLDEDDNVVGNATHLDFIATKNGNNYDRVAVKVRTDTTDISKLQYIVLQAAVTNENVQNEESTLKSVKFVQLLPIHIRKAKSDWVLRGSDYIVYDDKGANPSCYNDYYQLIGTEIKEDVATTVIKKSGFRIKTSDNKINSSYLPSLVSLSKDTSGIYINYKLQPTPLYISGLIKEIAIERWEGQELVYTCPLVILQNKYQIPAINNWNGELTVDQDGNKILAAMVGAGHKNDNNTFTGVLMGDVNHDNEKLTGLFGYDAGARVFELNTNGKAFIGKSGNGRIYIDGNTGTIKSAARESSDTKGTEFNLARNYIDVRSSSENNLSRIHLDVTTNEKDNDTKAYFSIDNNNGNRLINIADNDYYLQTDNYVEEKLTADPPVQGSGLKIDLKEGVLQSYNRLLIKGAANSQLYFGNNDNYVKLGEDNGAYLEMYKAVIDTEEAEKVLSNTKSGSVWKTLYDAFNGLDPSLEPTRDSTTYELTNKDDLKQRINDINTTIETDQGELDGELTTAVENCSKDLRTAQSKFNEKNQEYNDIRSTYETRLAYYRSLIDGSLDSQIANAKTDWTTAQSETIKKQGALNTAKSDLDFAEENRDDKQTEYDNLNDEFEQYKTERQNIENELAIETDPNRILSLTNRLNTVKDKIEELLSPGNNVGEWNDAEKEYFYKDEETGEETKQTGKLINAKKALSQAINSYDSAYQNWSTAYRNWDVARADEQEKENIYNELVSTKNNLNTELDSIVIELNTEDILSVLHIAIPEMSLEVDQVPYKEVRDNNVIYSLQNVTSNGSLWEEWSSKNNDVADAEDALATAQTNYDSKSNTINTLKTTYNLLNSSLNDYESALQTYQNAQAGAGDGSIKITNIGSKLEDSRIQVGAKFSVNGKGEINATGGTIGGWSIGGNYLKAGPSEKEEIFLLPTNQSRYRQVINGGLHTWWRILVGYNRTIDVGSDYWDKNPDKKATEYKFAVDSNGGMYASSGNIGGWTIAPGWLSAGGANKVVGMNVTKRGDYNASKGRLNWAFVAGAPTNSWADWDKAPFRVSDTGKFYATEGKISGNLEVAAATVKGQLTAATISADKLTAGTIDASVITVKNINASNITAGQMSVNRISGLYAYIQNVVADTVTADYIKARSAVLQNLYMSSDGIHYNGTILAGSVWANHMYASGGMYIKQYDIMHYLDSLSARIRALGG